MSRTNTPLVRFTLTVAGLAAGTAVLGQVSRAPAAPATKTSGPTSTPSVVGDPVAAPGVPDSTARPETPPKRSVRTVSPARPDPVRPDPVPTGPPAAPPVSESGKRDHEAESDDEDDDRYEHEGRHDDDLFEQEDGEAWEHGIASYLSPAPSAGARKSGASAGTAPVVTRTRRS